VLYALHTLGMLNEIDYRNGFSFSILVTLLSILEMGTCALAAVSKEQLLALLIIKLEPLTSVHTSRSAVLCRMRWPGRRLACPVGLLVGRCDCRLSAGQDSRVLPSPLPHRRRVTALSRSGRRGDVHVISHLLLTTHSSRPSSPTLSAAE